MTHTRKQLKEKAQQTIMEGIQTAFYDMNERHGMNEKDTKKLYDMMSKQMARVEKIFKYDQYSWGRG